MEITFFSNTVNCYNPVVDWLEQSQTIFGISNLNAFNFGKIDKTLRFAVLVV